jgi:hypothetical protein
MERASVDRSHGIVFVLSVLGVLIAAAVTDNGDDGQGFGARSAWLYVILLSIGYMISRGLRRPAAVAATMPELRPSTLRRDEQVPPGLMISCTHESTVPRPSGRSTIATHGRCLACESPASAAWPRS